MKKISRWILGAFFVATAATAQTDIPASINYQGRLTNPSDGKPVAPGVYHVEFRIWGHPTSTDAVYAEWGRSFPVHVVTNGLFNILLSNDGGTLTGPIPKNDDLRQAFQGEDRYLGIKITQGPDGPISAPEITPRLKLVSAPYAMHAQNCTEAVHATFADKAELDFSIPNTLAVGGPSEFLGTLHVSEETTMEDNLYVNGDIRATSPHEVAGFGTIPIGGIILWSGSVDDIPDGWALCDGATVNGHKTPDLQGRFVVCVNREDGYSPGDTGGQNEVTLTIDQMPKHHHGITTHVKLETYMGGPNGWSWHNTESGYTDYEGGDQPHENRPPYYALCYIMRVK